MKMNEESNPMFAIFLDSERYHITSTNGSITACGLPTTGGGNSIEPLRLLPARLMTEKPEELEMCPQCAAIKNVNRKS